MQGAGSRVQGAGYWAPGYGAGCRLLGTKLRCGVRGVGPRSRSKGRPERPMRANRAGWPSFSSSFFSFRPGSGWGVERWAMGIEGQRGLGNGQRTGENEGRRGEEHDASRTNGERRWPAWALRPAASDKGSATRNKKKTE